MHQRPVIVFTGKEPFGLAQQLARLCMTADGTIPFVSIEKTKSAIIEREKFRAQTRGIFLVNRKFGRGYDLKLGADALVCVLVNDPQMREAEVRQLLGRSCRAMGAPSGAIFMQANPGQGVDVWQLLRSSTVGQLHDGGLLWARIIKARARICPEDLRELKKGLEPKDGKWTTEIRKLRQTADPFLRVVEKIEARPDGTDARDGDQA